MSKYFITAALIVFISELVKRSDKFGALMAGLPLVTGYLAAVSCVSCFATAYRILADIDSMCGYYNSLFWRSCIISSPFRHRIIVSSI